MMDTGTGTTDEETREQEPHNVVQRKEVLQHDEETLQWIHLIDGRHHEAPPQTKRIHGSPCATIDNN